jgi:uncharacterized membrane protein
MELSRRAQPPVLMGATNGAIGAGFGSFIGYSARSLLSQLTGRPDIVWACIEDVLALWLGFLIVRRKI